MQRSASRRRVLLLILPIAGVLLGVGAVYRHSIGDKQHTVQFAYSPTSWTYGHADARFTVVSYSDLQCPYCADQFHILQRWIDEHPDVNWEWRHFPLGVHDPAATQSARMAQCVGEVDGPTAFWEFVGLLYEQSASPPKMSAAVRECLDSSQPDSQIRAHIAEAADKGITATPTLRVIDRHTGQSVLLLGTADGDGLLSATDALIFKVRPLQDR